MLITSTGNKGERVDCHHHEIVNNCCGSSRHRQTANNGITHGHQHLGSSFESSLRSKERQAVNGDDLTFSSRNGSLCVVPHVPDICSFGCLGNRCLSRGETTCLYSADIVANVSARVAGGAVFFDPLCGFSHNKSELTGAWLAYTCTYAFI